MDLSSCLPPSRGNISIYVLVLLARAEGQGRSVAARGDKQSKIAQCLELCSALNCLPAVREPGDLRLSGGRTLHGRRANFGAETQKTATIDSRVLNNIFCISLFCDLPTKNLW